MQEKPGFKRHTVSFIHAFDGLRYTVTSQPNLRIHLVIALLVVGLGIILNLNPVEWVIISFTIAWVITAEMINTALESIVDLITEERRQPAKIAKDVAAGMVLVGAITSVIVGLIIFLPHFI